MNEHRKFDVRPAAASRDELVASAPHASLRQRAGYSRFVRVMKFLLPTVAVGLVALIVLWPQIHINDNRFSIGFARLEASGTDFPSMVNARFVGTDKRNRPFSVTADIAKSPSVEAGDVELEMPKADMALQDGSWIALTANTGLYDQKKNVLKLDGAVNLFHDSGYEFKTSAADVDLAAGVATGTKPVEGQGPFGHLDAEGFRIIDNGKRMVFTGKAKLTIYPGVQGAGQ